MQNRKKLYRSLAGTALILFAGLALAPTLVSAGFHLPGKKPAPAPVTVELTQAPVLQATQKNDRHKLRDTSSQPEPIKPADATPSGASQQPEPQSGDREQHESDGYTAFAVNDFAPDHPAFSRGVGSGAAINVAANDAPATIAKFARKPKQPGTSNSEQPSNSGNNAPNDNAAGEHPNPQHNTPPSDQHDSNDETQHQQVSGSDNPETHPVASVPEPSSVALLAAGLIGLVIVRRVVSA